MLNNSYEAHSNYRLNLPPIKKNVFYTNLTVTSK